MVDKRPEQKIVEISYQQFGSIANKLVRSVQQRLGKNLDNISGVYGVPRGGTAFALHMSHHLGVPMLKTPEKNCIICEDISDSGNTLLPFQRKGYFIVALFCKKKSKVIPNVFFKMVAEEAWLMFPWESEKGL